MFENGKLDSRQAYFPEHLERPTISDAPPGTAWYIDINALLMDEKGKAWIDTEYPLQHELYEYDTIYCRTIIFEEGIVVDLTKTLDENYQQYTFSRTTKEELLDKYSNQNFKPIIGILTTKKDFKAVKAIFKERYGRNLKGDIAYSPNSDDKDKPTKSAANI